MYGNQMNKGRDQHQQRHRGMKQQCLYARRRRNYCKFSIQTQDVGPYGEFSTSAFFPSLFLSFYFFVIVRRQEWLDSLDDTYFSESLHFLHFPQVI